MNRNIQIFIVILMGLALSCGCARRGVQPGQGTPSEQLFYAAGQQFAAGHYDTAAELYHQYLNQFPDAGQVPAALVKLGMARVYLGQYGVAGNIFSRIQAQYPGNRHALEAEIGQLMIHHQTGAYEKGVARAGELLRQPLSQAQRLRVELLAGDSWMALNFPKDAYQAYLNAFAAASGDEEIQKVISRMKTALAMMEMTDLSDALADLGNRHPAGYLMYQLGLRYMDAGFAGDAVAMFSTLLREFPGHEHAASAQQFMEAINASAASDQHIIGCLLPLSGKYATFGHQALNGIEFALSEFSRARGIDSIRILVKDTAADPETALAALEELNAAHVSAVIGPIATADQVAVRAQALRIPLIALTQKPGITETGEYVFRNFLTPAMQLRTLVNYASDSLGARRFAILYPDENYGDVFMNRFWDEVLQAGGKVVGVEAYDPDGTDFADPIKKLAGLYYDIPEDLVEAPSTTPLAYNESMRPEFPRESPDISDVLTAYDTDQWHAELMEAIQARRRAWETATAEKQGPAPIVDFDAVFIPDSPAKAGLIIPQLAYYDISRMQLLGTNLWHADKLIHMAKRYVQGAVVPEGFFSGSRTVQVNRFVNRFRHTYTGLIPGFMEAVSYDTAWILFDLVTPPEVRFRAQVKQGLYAMPPFSGVTGTTTFDPSGEAIKDIYLLKVQGRRFVEIVKKGNLP